MIKGSFGGYTFMTFHLKLRNDYQIIQVHEVTTAARLIAVIDFHCLNMQVYDGIKEKSDEFGRTELEGFYNIYTT
jgi:hypothetical protein